MRISIVKIAPEVTLLQLELFYHEKPLMPMLSTLSCWWFIELPYRFKFKPVFCPKFCNMQKIILWLMFCNMQKIILWLMWLQPTLGEIQPTLGEFDTRWVWLATNANIYGLSSLQKSRMRLKETITERNARRPQR